MKQICAGDGVTPTESQAYFSELAETWDENYRNVVYRDRIHILQEWLKEKRELFAGRDVRVMDVGCGTGPAIAAYRQEGLLPLGVDISSAMLVKAKQHGYSAVVTFNGKCLPLSSESMLLGHMFNVMAFVDEPRILLGEIFRVLRPGGAFLLNIVNYKSVFYAASRIKRIVLRLPRMTPHPQVKTWFDANSMCTLLQECKFQNVRVYAYGVSPRIRSMDYKWYHGFSRNAFLGSLVYIECRKV